MNTGRSPSAATAAQPKKCGGPFGKSGPVTVAVKSPSNGAMKSPEYGGMKESAGTEPGIFAAQTKPNMPSMAARPLLISMASLLAFCSSDSVGQKPNGSNKFS